MIPKTIHYCWFGGNELSRLNVRCIDSWTKHCSDFEIVRWDETNIPIDDKLVKNLVDTKRWAFLSDYIRLVVVLEHGGVYLDTDIELVKNLAPLLQSECFVGFESPGRATNGVMGAKKGHLFLKHCLEFMRQEFNKGKIIYAPEVVSQTLKNYGDNVTVHEASVFYPYNPFIKDSVGQLMYADITPQTFAIHHWAGSWRSQMTIFDLGKRFFSKVANIGKRGSNLATDFNHKFK